MKTVKDLNEFVPQTGRLDWIGMAVKRMANLTSHQSAVFEVGTGLAGEHHSKSGRGKRQVTMIQAEHLPVVASLL
ncbi:MAG: MOSC domain-containing protein, partial [Planctomycetaceae bacterium]